MPGRASEGPGRPPRGTGGTAAPEPPAHDPRSAPAPAAADPAAQLAEAALDRLAETSGESIARAAREGRLFAEHGREVMAAFDAWRREAGRDADPAVFRAALRARWGIDLA